MSHRHLGNKMKNEAFSGLYLIDLYVIIHLNCSLQFSLWPLAILSIRAFTQIIVVFFLTMLHSPGKFFPLIHFSDKAHKGNRDLIGFSVHFR